MSSSTKNVPVYNLTVTLTPKSGSPVTITISRPFNQWFDAKGHFIAVPFQEMLASSVPAIGKLDARRAKPSTSTAPADGGYTAETPDAISSADATGSAAGAEAAAKKPTRRRA